MDSELYINLNQLLADFDKQVSWLRTLITDPTGSRYFQEKNQETRLQEFQEQIARVASFLEFAGNPQKEFLSVHIAGTSGKGSVVVILAAILTACQLQTGFHISPYLHVCNEKLIIDGNMIMPSEFVRLVKRFRKIVESWTTTGMSLRYGEAWVALTYLWFAQRGVDWAIIETGMGGRFDPTNVLPSKLAVITNVDFDHVPQLGLNLSDIAYHKAGIIKKNGIVVTSATNESVLRVIREEAVSKNAQLYCIGRDFTFTIHEINDGGAKISVETLFHSFDCIRIPLQGVFQPINAALAIMAADLLRAKYNIPLSVESVRTALKGVRFPGRMEVIQSNPLVILDAAHNPHKIRALVDSVQAIYSHKRVSVIIGALATKDASSIIEALLPITSRFIFTKPNVFGKPSFQPTALADIAQKMCPTNTVHVVDDVHESINLALQSINADELLLITGSLYLVGEARDYWIPREQLLKDIELRN